MSADALGSSSDELRTAVMRLQEELASSHTNLLPLADHVQSSYAACRTAEERAAAFKTARGYVTQALASVAYQVNEGASLLEQLLATEESQLQLLDAAMRQPRQQLELHMEHLGRRSIAAMTVQRKNVKARKVTKVAADPVTTPYLRKPLVYDALDSVGCGVPTVEDQHAKLAALQKSNERRFSNAIYYAPQRRGPPAEAAAALVEDIYGSVAPLSGKVKVSIPVAPPSARSGASSLYATAPGLRPVAPPVAPPSAPTAPRAPSAPSPSINLPPPPGPPPSVPPSIPPPPIPPASAAADNLYEDPSSGFYANAEPLAAKLPPFSPPPPPASATTGLVLPPPPPPPAAAGTVLVRAVALYDYQATQPDELTFFENEVVDVIARNNDGWFEGIIGDRRGLFPGNFVQEISTEESES